jgi:hypothetical protein
MSYFSSRKQQYIVVNTIFREATAVGLRSFIDKDYKGRRAERGIPVLPTPFVAFTTPWMWPSSRFLYL